MPGVDYDAVQSRVPMARSWSCCDSWRGAPRASNSGALSGARLAISAEPVVFGPSDATSVPLLYVRLCREPDPLVGGSEGNNGLRRGGGLVS